MPKSQQLHDGLTDTWGRRNRKLPDRQCPNCQSMFRPHCDRSHYCSRKCSWANNGGHNKKLETWWTNAKGYLEGKIWLDENTQIRVKKHRWIMEQHLGRKLLETEDVHHKDTNKMNNEISNLEVLPHGAHSQFHNLKRTYGRGYKLSLTPDARKARSERMKLMRATQARAAIAKAGGDK